MLRNLIALCLARRPLVLVAFAAFLGIGYAAFTTLNIEAYPDPAPPIIELIAQWPGQSPEEVERYVTIPIEIAVSSTPGLKYLRSNTVYALGFIRLQFEYGRDYHFVRQQTLNRLKDAVLPVRRDAGDLARRRHRRDHALSAQGSADDVADRAEDHPGLGGGAAAAHRAGHRGCVRARRQDQGIPGRDRSQQADVLRADTAADHHGDLGRQLECRRPHHLDGRAVGQRARARRHRLARRYRQHRAHPAGRRAGAAVRRRQGAGRFHAAARHRGARRDDRHHLRHRADAEARAHHGRGAARARRGRGAQHRRHLAAGREGRAVLRSRRSRRRHGRAP